MRKILAFALIVGVMLGVAPADAKTKRSALKSCLAALDAAESVGVESELYQENAQRCRTGVNSAEKVAESKGPYKPTAFDFQLSIITLEQQCFGSAGCNITYRVEVTYVGTQLPSKNKTYTVQYEIRGGEDVQISSFEIEGDQYTVPTEDFISTPPNPTLTAVVTGIIENP